MELSIRKLIEAIGTSVSEAQQSIEYNSIDRFFGFFQPMQNAGIQANNNGMNAVNSELVPMEPKTLKVVMPCQDDLTKTAPTDVPIVTLAHHRQVHLDKVTVKLKTRLQPDESNEIMADMTAPIANNGSSPDDSKGDDTCGEIELVFNVGERSEGMSRVVQNITKTI